MFGLYPCTAFVIIIIVIGIMIAIFEFDIDSMIGVDGVYGVSQ